MRSSDLLRVEACMRVEGSGKACHGHGAASEKKRSGGRQKPDGLGIKGLGFRV